MPRLSTVERERSSPGRGMLDKADAIISVLAERADTSPAELALAVGEPVSSTYRLLGTLMRVGWVSPGSKRGLYRLGLAFLRIGGQLESAIDIRERALPSLRGLLAVTGETSYLCVRQEERAVCIERLEGGDVRSLALTLGASLALTVGGAPQAILAYLPDWDYEATLERSMAADPRSGKRSRTEVDSAVRLIREAGIAISDGDVTPGVAAVGVPVFNHRGELAAAISVSGVRDNILGPRREEFIAAARECARAISDALGWHGEIAG